MKKILILILFSLHLTGSNINWLLPPSQLSSTTVTASSPQIGVDGNGNAVAVWAEGGYVKANSRPANGSWGTTPTTLSGSGASNPVLVCDSSGNATAAWVQNGAVEVASKTFSGSWSSATTLSTGHNTNLTLAIDAAGDIIAAWSTGSAISTATKLHGGNWQTVQSVSVSMTTPDISHVCIGGSGSNTTATIVWHANSTSGGSTIYSATKLISASSWGTITTLSGTALTNFPTVSVDSNGNSTAIWFSYQGSGINYYDVVVEAATKPFGGTWSASTAISNPGIQNPANLCLHVHYDAFGNAIALWNTSFDGATYCLQSSILPVGETWTNPINLVTDNLYAYFGQLSVASFGDAIALYMFYNGANVVIQSSELDITGFIQSTWSLPLNLYQQSANTTPFLTSKVNGNVVYTAATWLESNGAINSVLAAVGTKTVTAAPTNVTVAQSSQNFGVFTEYYNTLNWTASSDPTVVGYLIYRNGIFLTQVDGDVTQYIDNNRVQNAADVYGVAAVDNQNSHSNISFVTL